jgi:hypothetical protein
MSRIPNTGDSITGTPNYGSYKNWRYEINRKKPSALTRTEKHLYKKTKRKLSWRDFVMHREDFYSIHSEPFAVDILLQILVQIPSLGGKNYCTSGTE